MIGLDAASKDEVKQMVAKAEKLGAVIYSEPADHGWMYSTVLPTWTGTSGNLLT